MPKISERDNLENQKSQLKADFYWLVGMTGFEPATTRPPDEYATGLRHIPKIHFVIKVIQLLT